MPDGSHISVRVSGDQEFIRITGGSCTLVMDSGIVDALSIGELGVNTFKPGIPYEAGSALSYNLPFVTTEKSNGVRLNPNKGSTGQLSGKVTKALQFKGALGEGIDGQSFYPKMIDVVPATDPPTQEPDPADGSLWLKKIAGVLCPPSIFTGKTRLYVQAMYGLPLYYKGEGGKIMVNAPLTVESSTSAAPALWLPSYARRGDEISYPDILLDTSCGVWLDKTTGEHWLFHPTNGEMRIYPLKSNACGEKLREYLITRDNPLLPEEEDREHLEAYILAYSKPDVKNMQPGLGFSTNFSYFSLGYGWHWNWSGTRADIVVNDTFMQDENNAAMRSTHYSLSFTREMLPEPTGGFGPDDKKQNWRVVVNTEEGPADWSVYRVYWTITEPNYSSMILDKITPHSSTLFESNAPFYAFYKRDALQVCRVAVTYTPATTAGRTVESNCYGSNCVTTGMAGGSRTVYGSTGFHYDCTFTVGEANTPPVPAGYTEALANHTEVGNKTMSGWFAGYGGNPAIQNYTYPTSPDYGDGTAQETVTLFGHAADTSCAGIITFTTDVTWEGENTRWGLATIVAPFYDSEAIYMHHEIHNDTNYGATARWTYGAWPGVPGAFMVSNVHAFVDGSTRRIAYERSEGAFPSDDHNVVTYLPITKPLGYAIESEAQELLCNAGSIPATFTHLNEFHNNGVDEVGAEFATLTATGENKPIVVAPGYVSPVGLNGSSQNAPVIVGWV